MSVRSNLTLPWVIAHQCLLRERNGHWFVAPFFALLVLFAAFPLIFSLIITARLEYAFDLLAAIGFAGLIGLLWAGRSLDDSDWGFPNPTVPLPSPLALLPVTLPFSRLLSNCFLKYTAKYRLDSPSGIA